MHKLKFIVGLLLLYGIGAEYINASKQLFTFLDPGIISVSLLMIALCAWLIGSGLSKEKLKIKSFAFLKYFGLSFLIFLLIAFFSLSTYKPDPQIIKVNGIEVDIAEFMNGSKRIIPDEKQRKEYCICVVTKLTQDKELAEKYKSEFKSGKFSTLFIDIQKGEFSDKYNLNECINSITTVEWTAVFEKGVRKTLMNQLVQTDKTKTNDINKYCDCLVEEYKKIPFNILTASEFSQSQKAFTIDSVCDIKSKKTEN